MAAEPYSGGPARATLGAISFMRGQSAGLPGSRSGGGTDLFGGSEGVRNALSGIEQVRAGYEALVTSILGGNRMAAESVTALFGTLTGKGKSSQEALAGTFDKMAGQIFAGMGDYARRLGLLSGLAAKAFAALQSMNPYAAAAASIALIAIGQALKSLAHGVGKGGGDSSGSLPATSYSGGTSQTGTAVSSGGTQPVNIYLNGLKGQSPYDVERVLNRAGVDRDLRNRFRELVRTGANPALGY